MLAGAFGPRNTAPAEVTWDSSDSALPVRISRCSGATMLAMANACFGPSTSTAKPPTPRVASRSARLADWPTIRSTWAVTASATASDQVISQAMPSGPCSACTTRSMAAHSVGVSGPAITTTSDGPANAEVTPTTPETWRLASATYRLPGPTMTSTGSMDSVP